MVAGASTDRTSSIPLDHAPKPKISVSKPCGLGYKRGRLRLFYSAQDAFANQFSNVEGGFLETVALAYLYVEALKPPDRSDHSADIAQNWRGCRRAASRPVFTHRGDPENPLLMKSQKIDKSVLRQR
jgi:hypothetical protein